MVRVESRSPTKPTLFLTLPRAAQLLGISQQTLRDAVERGELPVYRVRRRWLRVDRAEAIEWVRSNRVEPNHEATRGYISAPSRGPGAGR